jgi:fructokinase
MGNSIHYGWQGSVTMINDIFSENSPHNVCVGTGFVAVDVVINGQSQEPIGVWAGGSCGNVLTILSYLGWHTYPIARIGGDAAGKVLLKDFTDWNVRTELLSWDNIGKTPLVIQKLRKKRDGSTSHSYDFYCPHCQHRLPDYKPVLLKNVPSIFDSRSSTDCFYFDRVQPSSLKLAELYKRQGALIFFEPSGVNDLKLFETCLHVADIVKISVDRAHRIHPLIENSSVPLTIMTSGALGLQYKLGANRSWKTLPPYQTNVNKDASGAGDWCSAGIIHSFSKLAIRNISSAAATQIEECLMLGQAMGALNCYYEGARGIMYNLSQYKFSKLIEDVMAGSSPCYPVVDTEERATSYKISDICPTCLQLVKNTSR